MKYAIVLTTNNNTFVDEMNSSIITCLHKILNKEMIYYVLDALKPLELDQIFIEDDDLHQIANTLNNDNVLSLDKIIDIVSKDDGEVLIIDSRMPYLTSECLKYLLDANSEHILTRYLVSNDVYCVKASHLKDESYETTFIDGSYDLCFDQILNRIDLSIANDYFKHSVNEKHMLNGVTIIDINNTYIDADVIIGRDSIIYPNTHLQEHTVIGENCIILPNSFLRNAMIGDNVTIDSSKIVESQVKSHTTIGPMSHLRNNCVVEENVRIGNFVEFKNTNFGEGSKCAHLTYVGDSDVGKDVNFGCGVVTVNYDGKYKYRTTIKDGAFIGSNVNLIAPVTIGENVVCAAGSTITDSVEDGDMGIARNRQSVVKGYGYKYKDKNKKRKD